MSLPLERIHRWDTKVVIVSFLVGSILEAGSLFAMFSTLGHAGPEGGFALVGWLSMVMHFPAVLLVAFLRLPENVSTARLAATIYAVQIPFVWYLTFAVIRFFKTRFRKAGFAK